MTLDSIRNSCDVWDGGSITGEHELPSLRNPPLSSLLQPMQVGFQRNENSSRENPPTKNLLSNMKCLFPQASWIVLQCVPGSRSGAGSRVSGVRPRWPSHPSLIYNNNTPTTNNNNPNLFKTGGHLAHLNSWWSNHVTCPASCGCPCRKFL